jgi:O-antigen/teichoic acid export membrane protein
MTVMFLLTPAILHAIGNEAFGLWALAYAMISMPFLLDFGMNAAVQKYAAALYVEGHEGSIGALLRGSIALPLLVWEAVAIAACVFRGWLAVRLAPSPDLAPTVEVLCWSAPALLGIATAMWCLDGALVGLRRMDLSNVAKVAAAVATAVLSVLALQLGRGVPGLLVANAGGIALGLGAECVALWLLLRHAQATGASALRKLRQVGLYSATAQVTNLLILGTAQLDKLMLAVLVGVSAVTAYELGWRLLAVAQAIPMVLMSVIIPASSELEALGDRAAQRKLYWTGSRLLATAYVPLVALLIAVAPTLVSAWVGSDFEASAAVLRLLALAAGLNLATGVATTVARGIGHPAWETAYVAGGVALRVPLALALIVAGFGLDGVLWANVVAMAASAAVFLVAIHRQLGLQLMPLVSVVMGRPVLATSVATLVTVVVNWHALVGALGISGRAGSLIELTVGILAFATIYIPLVVGLGNFTDAERSWAMRFLHLLQRGGETRFAVKPGGRV